MIPTLNKLDAIVLCCAMVLGGTVAALGVWLAKDQLVGVAAVLGAWLGPVGTMYAYSRGQEWKARAADKSRMDEQEAASVSGRVDLPGAGRDLAAGGGPVHPIGGGGDDPPPGPKGP